MQSEKNTQNWERTWIQTFQIHIGKHISAAWKIEKNKDFKPFHWFCEFMKSSLISSYFLINNLSQALKSDNCFNRSGNPRKTNILVKNWGHLNRLFFKIIFPAVSEKWFFNIFYWGEEIRGYPGIENRKTEIISSRITLTENGEARFTFNENTSLENANQLESTRLTEIPRCVSTQRSTAYGNGWTI